MLGHRSRKAVVTCSALALAAALAAMPQRAWGQSFQGTGTVSSGSASITTGAGTTDITVFSNQAVIDWTPTDSAISAGTPINFQSAGTTATFSNDATLGNNFAVLNRIVPADTSRPVQFNGAVVSQLQSLSGPTVTGGTVYFYSPGGIIVGPTAVFDVGNLGLTTAAPFVDTGGNWISGDTVQFQQAVSGTRVEIQAGAQINALSNGSYVAAFAPVVNQLGAISVNGQAALVSAEAGTITFSPSGLFDIQVTVGSDASVGLLHQGSTTGPASSGAGDNHRVYLVAVPKNQLLTMAIERGSSLGFDIAGAADVVGNAVVLSAGHNIAAGVAESAPVGGANGSISIDDQSTALTGTGIDFTSAVAATGSREVTLRAFRQTSFASDLSITAAELATVTANTLAGDPAGSLTIAGNLSLSVDRSAAITGSTVDSGFAQISAAGGATIDVGGDIKLSSQAFVDNNGDGEVKSGVINVFATDAGSLVTGGGDLILDGSAFAPFGSSLNARGANVSVQASNGGSVQITGGLIAESDGFGDAGALGQGHFVNVFANSGAIAFGTVDISADGFGGGGGGTGGAGQGGTVVLSATGPTGMLTVTGDAFLSADGFGASGGTGAGSGGAGTGGLAQLSAGFAGGTINVGGLSDLSAIGFGGGAGASGATGGAGVGGTAQLLNNSGGFLNLSGDVQLNADGSGGSAFGAGVTGGAGTGGIARALLFDSSIATPSGSLTVAGNFFASAHGRGGDGQACVSCSTEGGNGAGGVVRIGADAPGKTVDIAGNVVLNASGDGGGATVQAAGTALGGFTEIFSNGSSFNFASSLTLDPGAFGGSHSGGGLGGAASGGTARIATAGVAAGGTINVAGDATLFGDAIGGDSLQPGGIGGNAAGNQTSILALDGGSISFTGSVNLISGGFGGDGLATGGVGLGGNARIEADGTANGVGSTIGFGSFLSVTAIGEGGDGFNAGAGAGGMATMEAEATITAGVSTFVSADGIGGNGVNGGRGGNGTGGLVSIFADSTTDVPVSQITLQDVQLSANGLGGVGSPGLPGGLGGAGGNGIGGQVVLFADAGNGALVATSVFASASGFGGSGNSGGDNPSGTGGTGGAGGIGTGGLVRLGTESGADTPANTGSSVSIDAASLQVGGFGGSGGSGGAGVTQGLGGAGGDGAGGDADLRASGASLTVTNANIDASGVGGVGGTGSAAGIGGDAVSGTAGVLVTDSFTGGDRGTLNADFISANANAIGGIGSTTGTSTLLGGLFFDVRNSDATIGTATFFGNGDTISPSASTSFINVLNGDVNVSGGFSFFTDAVASVQLDNAGFTTDSLMLDASNWVLPSAAPANAGTFTVTGGIDLRSDLDFVTYANFDVPFDTSYFWLGAFRIGDYTSTGDFFLSAAGPVTIGDISAGAINLNSDQAMTLGAINSSATIDLSATQALSAGAITANSGYLRAFTDGKASIGGTWRSNDIFVQSTDIDIAAAGALDGGQFGSVALISTNGAQALIGDGLSGSGYALSNTEFRRIRGGNILVGAIDNPSQPVDMLIGEVSVSASQFPSGSGFLTFGTGMSLSDTSLNGRIRVDGAVTVTDITGDIGVAFTSADFELNAATGSISLSNPSNGIAGFLEIEADHLHVADNAILAKLRTDPLYSGHVEELNAPATTQRPEGVLRAFELDLEGNNTIYIQNTGSRLVPAGFLTTLGEGTEIGGEFDPPPGGREIVINGQLLTENGIVTGAQAFNLALERARADAMADGEEFGLDVSSTSTFNGCLILGDSCGSVIEKDPVASISSEIQLVSQNRLAEEPFKAPAAENNEQGGAAEGAAEGTEEDSAAEAEASSPIAPPAPLINTRPLNPPVNVAEPVSGTGNPAFFGSAVNESTAEEVKP